MKLREREEGTAGDYLGHFGLSHPPFEAAADARFLYAGRSYCAVRDEITQALQHQEGLILLLSESGTGKTTLCRSLLQAGKPSQFLSFITDPFLTVEDLLRQVLDDFGVSPEEARPGAGPGPVTRHDLVLAVQRFVESLDAADARVVIVIDDAHQLEPAVLLQLRALSNLETATVRLQLILVGQPSLDVKLQQPELQQLRQRVARRCVLQSLSNAETRMYLDHRLAAASDPLPEALPTSPALLTSQAGATLARVARGIPRTVNLLADRALQIGYERRVAQIDGPMVLEAARRLDVPISVAARLSCVQPVTAAVGSMLFTTVLLAWLVGSGRVHIGWPSAGGKSAPIASPGHPVATAPAAVPSTAVTAPISRGEPTPAGELRAADSYLVVAASFETAQYADDVIKRLAALNLPAFKREDSGRWHVVVIGPYASADEAGEVKKQIERNGFVDAHVRREPAGAPDNPALFQNLAEPIRRPADRN